MVSIKEVIEYMHSGKTFSLKVVQFDRRRKEKRGRVLEIDCGELLWGDGGAKAGARMERAPTDLERSLMGPAIVIDRRNPNHAYHYTRNVRVIIDGMKTEQIHKIHPALIIEFNGEKTMA